MGDDRAQELHALLTGEDDGRVCKDVPESACQHQPRNFLTHVLSLAATKTGDGLADPKLVLAWLLSALGAPAALIGLLVPVREAGSLLPQLFIAARIRRMAQRKWVWVVGSLLQGLAVIGMAVVALTMRGHSAGYAVLGMLVVFALARSLCSVSYKDVLGKTVSRSQRGTATGTAKTAASVLVLTVALAFSLNLLDLSIQVLAVVLVFAGMSWLLAAAIFSRLPEHAGATEGGENAISEVLSQWRLLRQDQQLRDLIVVRGLLLATALAPPYLFALAGESSGSLAELGPMMLASALAGLGSSYLWGRLADRSSRLVLIRAALLGALALAAVSFAQICRPEWLRHEWLLPGLLLLLMVAYQGVRIGRSTHLVDMAQAEQRASYTALANTAVGVLLLLSAGLGLLAQWAGVGILLGLLSACCLLAALVACRLQQLQ